MDSKLLTQADLDNIEQFADKVFAKVGIDVNFTRHFLDRVNDTRNRKQISVAELTRLFKQEARRWGKPIADLGHGEEAIMKDLMTNINVPFVLKWDRRNQEFDLVAKTIMRKRNFVSNNNEPEFPIESIVREDGNTPVSANSIKRNDVFKFASADYPMYQVTNVSNGFVKYVKHTSKNQMLDKKMKIDDFTSIKGLELFGTIQEDMGDYGEFAGYDYAQRPDRKVAHRPGKAKRLYPGAKGQTIKLVKRLKKMEDFIKTSEVLQTADREMLVQIKDALAEVFLAIHRLIAGGSNKQVKATESAITSIEHTLQETYKKSVFENVGGEDAPVKKPNAGRQVNTNDVPQVNEIHGDQSIGKDFTVSSDFDKFKRDAKPINKNGSPWQVNGYGIYLYNVASTSDMVVLVKGKEDEFLGGLYLVDEPLLGVYHTEVSFTPEIQGKGIAFELYKHVIVDMNLTVVSDTSQTKGSQIIWKKLATTDGIHVFGWHPQNPKGKEFFSWNPDEDDDDNMYTNRKALTTELRDAQDRLDLFVFSIEDKLDANEISKEKAMGLISDAKSSFDQFKKNIEKSNKESLPRRLVATKE